MNETERLGLIVNMLSIVIGWLTPMISELTEIEQTVVQSHLEFAHALMAQGALPNHTTH